MTEEKAETPEERLARWTSELRAALGEKENLADGPDDAEEVLSRAVSSLYETRDGWTPELGKEAEELRAGIENLIATRGKGDDDVGDWSVAQLQKLLDGTDARDSLKWLENKDATTIIYFKGSLYMKLSGSTYKIVTSPQVETLVRKLVEEAECPPKSSSRSKSTTPKTSSST